MMNDYGISREDAVHELQEAVARASDHMFSEYSTDWEVGEAYYAGKCDLPVEEGRSTIVKTEARDVIRSIMPNVMRILLQSNKPVTYLPTTLEAGKYAAQQSLWINHLFLSTGGYTALFDAALESMKLKAGPIKVHWVENPAPEHIYATGLTAEQVIAYQDLENVVIDEVEDEQSSTGGLTFSLRGTRYHENGKIEFEPFPIYEFFVAEKAANLNALHGHRRSVTVSEAIEMGLTYDNWRELDNDDPKTNDAASVEQQKRGYVPNEDEDFDGDLANHEFLLTEAYCQLDMDGDGIAEKYVFYFGGSQYQYLHHEQIEDFNIAVVCVDPQPFSVIGRSIVDVTKQSQDNETSLLRAIMDNAHQANNPRMAGDPVRTNFNDLMTNGIGAPIRTKGRPEIQVIDVPFTGQGLLPFLDWLERDAETRVGSTKAARGLDPDALQSTDKDAVLNTIQMSQGQVELMVRNIVNTGLIPLFRMALRLATRHMDRQQVMLFKGEVVQVDLALFDPNLAAIPNVGIGTAAPEQKLSALQFVYQEQQKYMAQFGLDNPFTSLSQVFNTLEDMLALAGLNEIGRYFNHITPENEQVIAQNIMQAQAQAAEQQQQNMPLDPGKALMMTESMKARVKQLELSTKQFLELANLQQRALEKAEELDFKRDDLVQDRVIRLAELGQGALNDRITREQQSTQPKTPSTPEPKAGGGGETAAQ